MANLSPSKAPSGSTLPTQVVKNVVGKAEIGSTKISDMARPSLPVKQSSK